MPSYRYRIQDTEIEVRHSMNEVGNISEDTLLKMNELSGFPGATKEDYQRVFTPPIFIGVVHGTFYGKNQVGDARKPDLMKRSEKAAAQYRKDVAEHNAGG